jgi:hypothetical protein
VRVLEARRVALVSCDALVAWVACDAFVAWVTWVAWVALVAPVAFVASVGLRSFAAFLCCSRIVGLSFSSRPCSFFHVSPLLQFHLLPFSPSLPSPSLFRFLLAVRNTGFGQEVSRVISPLCAACFFVLLVAIRSLVSSGTSCCSSCFCCFGLVFLIFSLVCRFSDTEVAFQVALQLFVASRFWLLDFLQRVLLLAAALVAFVALSFVALLCSVVAC